MNTGTNLVMCASTKCVKETKNLIKNNPYKDDYCTYKKRVSNSKEQAVLDKCYFKKCSKEAKSHLDFLYNKIKNKKNKSKELQVICENAKKLLSIPVTSKDAPKIPVYQKMYTLLSKYQYDDGCL